jgi:hypothetical protein
MNMCAQGRQGGNEARCGVWCQVLHILNASAELLRYSRRRQRLYRVMKSAQARWDSHSRNRRVV